MNREARAETANRKLRTLPKAQDDRRKRLGQYFTGPRLSSLLAALADGQRCHTAVDPMCGSGDLLAAVRTLSPAAQLAGIEIDPVAASLCANRFRGDSSDRCRLIVGNAFSREAVSQLSEFSFDLVITNPPYVRYQALSGSRCGHRDLPDAEEVRRGLIDVIDQLTSINDDDREVLRALARGYSGLSDLAVPSWLLCAAMTAVGGRIAMVMPESWLSREYARPIHYLLSKMFRLQYVVEDANRGWFDDASVKTTLVIAVREPAVSTLSSHRPEGDYLHISLPRSVMNEQSVVGQLFPDSAQPDLAFVGAMGDAASLQEFESRGVIVSRRPLLTSLNQVLSFARGARWLSVHEPDMGFSVRSNSRIARSRVASVPPELSAAFPDLAQMPFTTLGELGANVGQGLRTGANGFFYVDLDGEQDGFAQVTTSNVLGLKQIAVPAKALRPVLRRQSEAPSGFRLDPDTLRGRVLDLDSFVHPSDAFPNGRYAQAAFLDARQRTVMPPGLAALVDAAATANIGSDDEPRFIPDLSAVRTNASSGSLISGSPPRFWYMLPTFGPRHVPELFVARVNHKHPRVMLNSQPKVVIDANFSTISLEGSTTVSEHALLALLNSSWSYALMEMVAAVMGGGALKLEAAHIRRLPIPQLDGGVWRELGVMGVLLADGEDVGVVRDRIDLAICEAVFGTKRAHLIVHHLRQIATVKLEARRSGV